MTQPSSLLPIGLLLALVGIAAAPLAARAQLPGPSDVPSAARVSGTVVSAETGVPVPGVTVEAEGARHRTSTNARGAFNLSGLPSHDGGVSLVFTRIGFETDRRSVSVSDGGTARVEVRLTPRAIELDPVAILLERTRMVGDPLVSTGIPGSAFVLERADLDATRLAFANVHDALRRVPGVTVYDEEGYGLRPHIGLRGAGAERSSNVTLMEDGVLIAPAPYSAPAAYYFPTLGRMDAIEVRKGASQVRYGPRTLGGAVNLVSSAIPDRRSWLVDVAGGRDAMVRARARVGDAGDRMGWLIEGYRIGTDGFKELEGGGSTGFETRDLVGRLRFNTDRAAARYQELELKLGVSDHVSDETYLGLTEEDFRARGTMRYAASGEDVMRADHQLLQARYLLRPGARTDVVVTAYDHNFDRNWYKLNDVDGVGISAVLADPDGFTAEMAALRGAGSSDLPLNVRANNRSYAVRGIQATFGFRSEKARAAAHALEIGVRIHADEEDRLQWDDAYRMDGGGMVRISEGTPGTQANRLNEARAVALFVQDEIRLGRWALVPGLRYETVAFTRTDWSGSDPDRTGEATVRENDVSALIPGLGVTWEWSPRTHVFAGVHRGFGPPGPGADRETRPESSVNWEAGLRVRRPAVGLDLTGFFSDYDNILGRATLATGESGSGDLFNGGAVAVWGVEAAADADAGGVWGRGVQLPVRVAYTYTHATFRSEFASSFGPWGDVGVGDRLPYLPEHVLSGNLGAEDAGWAVGIGWNAATRMRTEAGRGPIAQDSAADAFLVFDLTGRFDLAPGASLYGAVQNLTDERYVVSRRPAGARPGLPRTFVLGLRVER